MLNIVVPMAGAGSRFSEAGYSDPKPLIPVHGLPMIQLVIRNLTPRIKHRFIFICQQTHIERYGLEEKLRAWAPGCIVHAIDGVTDGAACTVLTVKQYIDSGKALMIANSDQFVAISINDYLARATGEAVDGLIMTMSADDPKWSFVATDDAGFVSRVVEKEVISNEATVGIYNFKFGSDFVAAAEKMIAKDLKVNGEFYVAPVYNILVEQGRRIATYNVGSVGNGMYGLGTPNDLDAFLKLNIVELPSGQL